MNLIKKTIILFSLGITALAMSGCTTNNNTTNHSNTLKQVSSNNTINNSNTKKITVYIDKNCENAKISQCNPNLWKKQLTQVVGSGNLAVKYLDAKTTKEIKDTVDVSPVLVVPNTKVSLFGKQAETIKKQSINKNGNYYIPLYSWIPNEENSCNDEKDNNGDGKIDANDPSCYKMEILTSSNCKEQYCNKDLLKQMLMGYNIKFVDYDTKEGKQIYSKLKKGQNLPAIFLNKEHKSMKNMKQLIKDVNIDGYTKELDIPSFKYNPSIEACATNCNASPSCSKLLSCNKTEKPNVDVYVMAYCPFGTQAEKGLIPAVNLLGNKINFKVKFVDYEMHGKKSIDEDNLQYCIQKEQNDKYIKYLTCFLEKGDTQTCRKTADIDMNKANTCIKDLDKKYNITGLFNDKTTWLNGQFPQYNVYKDENVKYGVQGSPTLVINGIKVQPASRSPKSYLDAICKAFKNKPAECNKILSNKGYDAMFGWTQNGKAAPAGSCGK